jgi:hypothetical protein
VEKQRSVGFVGQLVIPAAAEQWIAIEAFGYAFQPIGDG